MKESMLSIVHTIDFQQYVGYSTIFYFFLGFVITLLTQSSSSTITLVLISAYSGIVDYRMGVALML